MKSRKDISSIEVGDTVVTVWDDEPRKARATVEDVYRGHRGKKFVVQMPDGTHETIGLDQVESVESR